MSKRWMAAMVAMAAVALTLAACGSSSNKTSTGAATTGGPTTTAAAAASNDNGGGAYGGYGSTSGSDTTAAAASGAALKTGSTTLGTVVVDDQGHTLYAFAPDSATASQCNTGCDGTWPPLTAQGQATAGSGLDQSKVTTLTRTDGTKQLVYNGHPLYRYAGDSKSGDVNGQGIGGKWHVMTPSGDPKM